MDNDEFLQRFQIFADCSGGFAAFDRTDGSIWYSEGDDLHQVDVNLGFFRLSGPMIPKRLIHKRLSNASDFSPFLFSY